MTGVWTHFETAWFGFFVQWHINLCRLFNAKDILIEEQQLYYLTHSWEDKRVHTFPKGICLKVNVIARLEYELTYCDSTVHCFNHYTTRTPPLRLQSSTLAIRPWGLPLFTKLSWVWYKVRSMRHQWKFKSLT